MVIQSVPIRATIICAGVSVETPYVLSFNVTKTRNRKSTFSASLKIPSSDLSKFSGNVVEIYAGRKSDEIKIFTGYILSTRPSICFDDPKYTVLSIAGADTLFLLEGEKYTRRQIDSKQRWAIIDSVTRKAEKGGQFQMKQVPVQVIGEDMIPDQEKTNKNKGSQTLDSTGSGDIPDGIKVFDFKLGKTTLEGES